ncbi:hypothetical protein NP233_g7429 [Leucocoprinus birnbaumii]|uniref:Phosphatidylglycerol/phosphatidylinositol transfer protein n=1 Tax=Leucocoprinus birnbaumii TaxID=56174 RepID=A0AAD5VSK1_9AGAR|nr:hypothetical protein NP233_g7429 [Leucocoprinus birnbaumii]
MRVCSIIGTAALTLGCVAAATPLNAQDFSVSEFPQVIVPRPPNGVSWKNCGEDSDPIQVKTVEIVPNPPKPGEDFVVKVTAEATQEIKEGAYADVVVKLGLIKLLSKQFDLCDEARNAKLSVQCPVQPGQYVVEHKVTLPKETPPMKFNVQVQGYTVEEEPLVCLNLVADFILHPF